MTGFAEIPADTIVAIATPPGRGGIGIVRISGARVQSIAQSILGKLPQPRAATYSVFCDVHGDVIDAGISVFFPAPHSFTGEDVLELQGHGGPVVLDMVLQCCVQLGARLARPGEFSERAFLNDKLDLAQAEAIADLIDSASQRAARLAMRSLQGEFSRCVHELVEQVIALRTHVEAALDFPEEEIDFLAEPRILTTLDGITQKLTETLQSAQQGQLLREGITVVIAGRPNAGKSTLLNQFSGRDSAIVTPIPGTTRDVLREYIHIDGLPMHIVDTAGLRNSEDQVEQEGVRRAWQEIRQADRILYLIDATEVEIADDSTLLRQLSDTGVGITLVLNKSDVAAAQAPSCHAHITERFYVSAKTGAGIDALREHLKACVGYQPDSEGGFLARRRHLDALHRAQLHMGEGRLQLTLHRAGELFAEELHLAQQALNEITGEFTADDLLGKIFSSFCIGK